MPYLETEDKTRLQKDWRSVSTEGDLNFLITEGIKKAWAQNPRYATIHFLKKDLVINPEKSELLARLFHGVKHPDITRSDVYTAAALAFDEFYRRVASVYESEKMITNGDVYHESVELAIEVCKEKKK